jgi:hypothetical protein
MPFIHRLFLNKTKEKDFIIFKRKKKKKQQLNHE